MKEIALQIAREAKEQKLNVLREYLQNYILFIMQRIRMSSFLYFVGGTALRFLYQIRRYSEDLDFSAGEEWNSTEFLKQVKKIERALEKAGYSCAFKIKEEKNVQRAVICFYDLLYDLGLTQHKRQNLFIHIEIDKNPPAGWKDEKTIVDIHLPVVLQHYDLPSTFATKLAAVLTRPYTKGRDLYDLFWFRSKWKDLFPNFKLLNNAIAQKQGNYVSLSEKNWLKVFHKKIQFLNWENVKNDVIPFLEIRDDEFNFTQENLLLLLLR